MTVLRESTKKKIVDALDKSHFTASSFSVTFAEGQSPFVIISFIPEKKFCFTIGENFGGSGYMTVEAPGHHIESGEEYERTNLESCFRAISSWASRILEDYRSKNPVLDEFESLRKTLIDQFEQHVQDKHAHFTATEAYELRSKLDELTNRMQELLEKNEQYEYRLKEATNEIDRIKADLEMFPKGVWYRMAGSKMVNIIKKVAGSKEGRELALEVAKNILIEGPK